MALTSTKNISDCGQTFFEQNMGMKLCRIFFPPDVSYCSVYHLLSFQLLRDPVWNFTRMLLLQALASMVGGMTWIFLGKSRQPHTTSTQNVAGEGKSPYFRNIQVGDIL